MSSPKPSPSLEKCDEENNSVSSENTDMNGYESSNWNNGEDSASDLSDEDEDGPNDDDLT